MNQDHLSAAEVAIFREDSFSSRSIEIGRHLLTCRECRAKLPAVTPQEFRECVLGADGSRLDESEQEHRFFVFPILSFARVTAFAGFAILLVAGIYFVGTDRFGSFETSVVKNEEYAAAGERSPVVETTATAPTLLTEKEQLPIKRVIGPGIDSDRRRSSRKNDERTIVGVAAREPKVRNAETRGNEEPCSAGATINVESKSDGNGVFLKWNAVKGAQSYAVYISDLEERLVDRFETRNGTSYTSRANFERSIVYKWRLIITLKSGETVVGDSQKLLLDELKLNKNSQRSSRTHTRSEMNIRCSEKN